MIRAMQTASTGMFAQQLNIDTIAHNLANVNTTGYKKSKMEFQDLIREKLKKRGYRVLVISDPDRALARFSPDEEPPADCVLFSAPELSGAALDAYNQFGTDTHTADIPAILLVDRKQQFIIRNAKGGPKRIMLAMPLKVRELRTALLRLLKANPATESE